MTASHLFTLLSLASLASLAATAAAQPPTPIPRNAPRAHWKPTPGVTGTPTQRRDNPGAASHDKMYVFGGRDGNAGTAVRNALYEFDGAAWTLKTAEGAAGSPPARGGACVAWDRARSKLVVFGGDTGGTTPALLGDTWEWDPTTNAWTDVTPNPSPSPRRWAAMAYDPSSGGMLLFGGDTQITPTTPTNDTWLFFGGAWTQLGATTSPPVRRLHSLVTRPDFGDVFLCAGDDSRNTPVVRLLDAWRFTMAGGWVPLLNPTFPQGSFPHGTTANQAVYDELRQRVVLQGGQGISVPNTAGGGQYGDDWGGSPSSWCSEYDPFSNEWKLYGQPAFGTADTVIGRVSRYYAAYIPALGKIYKVSGQNPSGTGTITGTCEYQAIPLASSTPYGAGCTGSGGVVALAASNAPWTTRVFRLTTTNLAPTSLAFGVVGFSQVSIPLSNFISSAGPGCNVLANLDVAVPLINTAGSAELLLGVPDNTALAGAILHAQTLQIEPTVPLVTSSNGVSFTIGAM